MEPVAMEASPLATSTAGDWTEQFEQSLHLQRDRIRAFLDAQQSRLGRAEAELALRIEQLAEDLAHDRREIDQARDDVRQQSERLAEQTAAFQALKDELAAAESKWHQGQQRAAQQQEAMAQQFLRQQEQIAQQQQQLDLRREELAKQQSQLDAAEAALHHDRQALSLARQGHKAEREQLAALDGQLQSRRTELDMRQEQLDARQAETESRRRHIARELKARHAEQLDEIDRRRAELDRRDAQRQAELEEQLEAAHKERETLEGKLDAVRTERETLEGKLEAARGEQENLRQQFEAIGRQRGDSWQQTEAARAEQKQWTARCKAAEERGEQLEAEVRSLRDKCDRLETQVATQAEATGDREEDTRALEDLRTERDALATQLGETEARLTETQQRLVEARQAGPATKATDDDAQRRYEMVVEDLRGLRAKNAELQEQLTRAQSERPAARAAGGALNWEAEKKRILAALEAGDDGDQAATAAERLEIEDLVRRTDQSLAEKERECNELRQLLQDQSANLGAVAVGAAALGQVLDADEVVQEEREKLKGLQEQCREKLRQAEIEISMERAKLAREKAQLDERLSAAGRRDGQAEGDAAATAPAEKPVRGRWLERLGLKDSAEETPERPRQ